MVWRASNVRTVDLTRPLLMGIVNCTPDSFSDGGNHLDPARAASAACRMVAAGAGALDIGGESTRPGAARVDAAEQIRRVVPVIAAVRRAVGDGVVISVDTTLAPVARSALDAGADAINDVSAGLEDEAMLPLVAERGAGIVLMHRHTTPERDVYSHQYAQPPIEGDVVAVVAAFLSRQAGAALAAGVARESIVLDPGLGFGKTVEQNLELIERTAEIARLGFPVLSGLSRKSFTAIAGGLGPDSRPAERDGVSAPLSARHRRAGAAIFRVHDVAVHAAVLKA